MQLWVLPITLLSTMAYSASNIIPIVYEVPEYIALEEQNSACESIVCKDMVKKPLLPKVGDVPKRVSNKTIETIGSVVYLIGEVSQTNELPIDEMIEILSD
ncbi:hypothetical protein [Vibrio parahaemolyticus]|uniref:hypothetical protein n=1 Tax=Vibrio parahaemolyticus TaxID=670 RepID=UPI001123EF9F|nr:hypothetical protein [Vibrio parahaemolyticus]EIU6870800.1 hypothetical protein [Vibrio parahaemolyticus]TOH65533.1 hypothetical protein CGI76_23520 [Vibrio parahaemolyticus]TOI58922.1 hypothetical protein CGI55_25040 [Vibrio parahaemolyticus]